MRSGNALRVVEAIDADADDLPVQPEIGRELAHPQRQLLVVQDLDDAIEVRTDRDRQHAHGAVAEVHDVARHRGAQLVDGRLQEVALVARELEREQVVAEEAFENLLPERADAQPIAVGPRDVPEERGAQERPPHAEVLRDQREVVVVEEHRRFGRRLERDRFREQPVDVLIRVPVLRPEDRTHVRLVAERPQAAVREAGVVALLVLRRQPEPAQPVRRRVGRHFHGAALVDDLAIGRARGVRDPDAAAIAHQRVERDGHAARRRPGANRSVRRVLVHPRLAIRHDDEAAGRAADLLALGQRRAKRDRPGQLVERDDADHHRLEPRAPVGILDRDEHGQAERDVGGGHQRAPEQRRLRPLEAGEPRADARPGAQQRQPQRGERERREADGRQRLDVHRGAERREEQHEHRRRAARDRVAQDVAGAAERRARDEARREPGEQRLELQPAADPGDERGEREQDDRDLAADEPQVQPEDRAHQRAERDRAAERPQRRGQQHRRVRRRRSEHRARHLQDDGEQQDRRELDEHDCRGREIGERAAGAALGDDGDRHRRRHARRARRP